jgi:DNA-binding transcriptional LysR family regulator
MKPHPGGAGAAAPRAEEKQSECSSTSESIRLRRLLDERCAQERLDLRPVLSTNSIQAVRNCARRGGVALVPTVTISHDLASGQVVGSPLADAALANTTIAVCIPASGRLSPASRDFLSHLDRALAGGPLEE